MMRPMPVDTVGQPQGKRTPGGALIFTVVLLSLLIAIEYPFLIVGTVLLVVAIRTMIHLPTRYPPRALPNLVQRFTTFHPRVSHTIRRLFSASQKFFRQT